MRILVCIKQVPDLEGLLNIDETRRRILFEGTYRMNRFDEFALEEALKIREERPVETIDVISVGPPRVTETLRKALGMGASRGIHVHTGEGRFETPLETASMIAAWAREQSYDLILTGVMAEDDMHCQVGQMTAALMGYPCAASVIHRELDDRGETLFVEREIEGGRHVCLTLALPALLTIQSGINRPRYPALSNVLRARHQELTTIEGETLSPPAARERVTRLRHPAQGTKGIFLSGTTEEKAQALLVSLHERGML
ncbi:MAG: electron transfer flavoprotein subunit beta/FixA family protein [Deltaproteobacteria bacterium]|nr:electron transfer flavoprotein subunit beta/FixA family protein [Deltaproteobacteria bacterium]